MTKFNSLARARVIGQEGGAWGGGASGDAKEGAAGVDVLVVSSSTTLWDELFHYLHQFSLFCTEFHAVTKWSKMHPNTMKRSKTWRG